MGLAELADMLVGGAGEGALLVAEQDAFDQVVGDGAAIDGDEGLRATVAGALDGARDQLLADARFALDEDRDLRGGGALAEADDALHGRAAGDDVAEGEGAGDGALHARDLAFQRAELERVLDGHLQALGRCRLDHEIDRAGAHGVDHRVDAAVRRLHDDRKLAVHLAQLGQNPHAVEVGHHEVEDDQRHRVAVGAGEQGDGGLTALDGDGGVAHALHRRAQQAALDGVVVDDEDGGRHDRPAGSRSGWKLSLCGTIMVAAAAISQWNQWSW